MTIYEIVKKLIGRIEPIGETNADASSFENLKEMTDLVDEILSDIGQVATQKDSHMFSVKRAGEYAREFLDNIN